MKYADELKELFINMISVSSYPAVTTLDIAAFATRCHIVEGNINMQHIDRLFIAASF